MDLFQSLQHTSGLTRRLILAETMEVVMTLGRILRSLAQATGLRSQSVYIDSGTWQWMTLGLEWRNVDFNFFSLFGHVRFFSTSLDLHSQTRLWMETYDG